MYFNRSFHMQEMSDVLHYLEPRIGCKHVDGVNY